MLYSFGDVLGFLPVLAQLREWILGPFSVEVKQVLYDMAHLPRSDGSHVAMAVNRIFGHIVNRSSRSVSILRLDAQLLDAGKSDPTVSLSQFNGPRLLQPGEALKINLSVGINGTLVQSLIVSYGANTQRRYTIRERIDREPD